MAGAVNLCSVLSGWTRDYGPPSIETPKAKEKLNKTGSFLLLRQGEKEKTRERFLPKALSGIDILDIQRLSGI